eukprot:1051248-Pyramimonas_sp.AAC.1
MHAVAASTAVDSAVSFTTYESSTAASTISTPLSPSSLFAPFPRPRPAASRHRTTTCTFCARATQP